MTLNEFLTEWNNDSDRLLVHTSGSTGKPKPLWVEKRRMLASARITCRFLGLQPGDTALLCMPLDYIAGKMMVVRAIHSHLRLITVEPSGHPLKDLNNSLAHPLKYLDPSSGWPILNSQFSILNFAAMVPLQVYNSLQVPEERERLMQIRHLIIGGGAIDEALERELQDFPNAVWSTYGMTETLSHVALRRLSGPQRSSWYTPLPSVSVALSPEGCLIVNAPEVCDEPIVTNDIAELAPDGSFRILGRKDNVICSGGIKIQIEEVERVLRPHLAQPFLISKRPDPKFGEAVVLLTEGDALEAQAVCRQELPRHWCPRHYLHVDRIPLTATGKPARAEAQALCSSYLPV